MRLSRPRLLLRAALLALGGAYMVWHALDLRREARGLDPAEALLRERFALLWALVALVAFATAAVALLSLRRRPPRQKLRLDRGDDPRRGPQGSAPGGSTQ